MVVKININIYFYDMYLKIKLYLQIEMPRSHSPVVKKYVAKPTPTQSVTSTQSVYHHHNVEVEKPGFFSNMWQGFGLGAGQAIAHNVFRNEPTVKVVHEQAHIVSETEPKEYVQCMKDNSNDKELCKQFLK